uniref:Zinc finger, CCHC-type n=1 Tax=Tanacetum cinerariifolium TaxID=118510 RepID=A0A6L2L033_TANCI|nr:zinc finger, CCHC-type [Tanacetum cinerariifolium]
MHFLLKTFKVVYVLTTLMPELIEDGIVEAIRQRAKWENDNYICRGHILNGMYDPLFDIYQNVESAKELWDSLESKYMTKDALSKKFLMSNFNNYKMVDAIAWWIDSGTTTHVFKDRCWFKTYEPVEDGSVLYMGDDHFALVMEKEVKGCRAVFRLSNPKRKTLGEKGIDCIFVGYAEHSKAFRPKDIIPKFNESQRDDHSNDVASETPKPCRGKRARKDKSYGFDFQLYLVEGSRDQIKSQYSYCYSIEEDPKTYSEAMQSQDAAFWKEAIDDEISSNMENNTWVLSDLPPG